MQPKQEFLVIAASGDLVVYTPSTFPAGTAIGPDARRLGVDGASLVHPPKDHFSPAEFDQWCRELEQAGFAVTLGPFWRNPVPREQCEEALRGGAKTWTLEEFRNALLGGAGGNGGEKGHQLESLERSSK
jgi:hypothetical protein